MARRLLSVPPMNGTEFDAMTIEVEGVTEADERLRTPVARHLLRELVSEFNHPTLERFNQEVANSNVAHEHTGPAGARAAATENNLRALYALRLSTQIGAFVKSERPAAEVTLNNTLAAKVEIERVGPNEVALTLVGHHGPPSPEAVTRIREELESRGLRIAVLAVA